MNLLDKLVRERKELGDTREAILTRAADESRDLTTDEDANLTDLTTRAAELDKRIAGLNEIRIADAKAAEVRSELNNAAQDAGTPAPTGGNVIVRSEPKTYEPDSPNVFFRDLYNAQVNGDLTAKDRLARHMVETRADGLEERASDTSNATGLVVPQYLTDMAAPLVRAGRPMANICNRQALPADGMVVNVSRMTTGSSVTAQASQNAPVADASPDDTLLAVNVNTYAGKVDLSRQLVDRGTGFDTLVAQDMGLAYATAMDAAIISGDGTGGTHLGVLNTSGIDDNDTDDASPSAAETYQAIVKSIGNVNAARFLPANIIVMHPRRWAYIYGGLDSSNRPLVEPQAVLAQNPVGIGEAAAYGQVVGNIAGVPVVTDANIPTNLGAGTDEDRIIVARREDLILWEDGDGAPRQARVDMVAAAGNTYDDTTLTVRLVAYGYSAFTAGRYPTGVSVIQGSLLAATL